MTPEEEVAEARRAFATDIIAGHGIEVGAGTRPFPIPPTAKCFYGDIRSEAELAHYFKDEGTPHDGQINAATLEGIPNASLDFVISAHVIEHLPDPIGCFKNTMRVLKPGGVFLLAVPDRRHTFDRLRPGTPLAHLLQDYNDGGASTRMQGFEDHARYVHPALTGEFFTEEQIAKGAANIEAANMDIHFHCWTTQEFTDFLSLCCNTFGAELIKQRGGVVNENLYAVRKL